MSSLYRVRVVRVYAQLDGSVFCRRSLVAGGKLKLRRISGDFGLLGAIVYSGDARAARSCAPSRPLASFSASCLICGIENFATTAVLAAISVPFLDRSNRSDPTHHVALLMHGAVVLSVAASVISGRQLFPARWSGAVSQALFHRPTAPTANSTHHHRDDPSRSSAEMLCMIVKRNSRLSSAVYAGRATAIAMLVARSSFHDAAPH